MVTQVQRIFVFGRDKTSFTLSLMVFRKYGKVEAKILSILKYHINKDYHFYHL